jgi:hypothetical protein
VDVADEVENVAEATFAPVAGSTNQIPPVAQTAHAGSNEMSGLIVAVSPVLLNTTAAPTWPVNVSVPLTPPVHAVFILPSVHAALTVVAVDVVLDAV